MDWAQLQGWVFGGGLMGVLAFALKANAQMRQLKFDAAKAKAEVEAQRAKEAQFEASIAESSTKVAGEGILKGLLSTLVQREQSALTQLADARREASGFRYELAEIKEREDQCQVTLRQMQQTQLNVQDKHDIEIRALHGKISGLNDRIYNMSQRLLQAGGAFTATDVVPDHGSDR